MQRLADVFGAEYASVGFDPYTVEDGLASWAAVHKRFGYPQLGAFGSMPAAEYLCLMQVLYREGVEAVVDSHADDVKRKLDDAEREAKNKAHELMR